VGCIAYHLLTGQDPLAAEAAAASGDAPGSPAFVAAHAQLLLLHAGHRPSSWTAGASPAGAWEGGASAAAPPAAAAAASLQLPASCQASPHARSFVAACLTLDPAQRPTCGQLLEHPWLMLLRPGEAGAAGRAARGSSSTHRSSSRRPASPPAGRHRSADAAAFGARGQLISSPFPNPLLLASPFAPQPLAASARRPATTGGGGGSGSGGPSVARTSQSSASSQDASGRGSEASSSSSPSPMHAALLPPRSARRAHHSLGGQGGGAGHAARAGGSAAQGGQQHLAKTWSGSLLPGSRVRWAVSAGHSSSGGGGGSAGKGGALQPRRGGGMWQGLRRLVFCA
jgi:serine/threonine protein kinase